MLEINISLLCCVQKCPVVSSSQSFLAQDINPIQLVVTLMDHHDCPPLGDVGPLRPGHHEDGLVKVDVWECVHSHVGSHILLQALLCNLLK